MENKGFKKKLTLSISGSTYKRSDKIEYVKSQNKSSVIVEKKNIRSGFKKLNQQFDRNQIKSGIKIGKIFNKDSALANKDFEKRKLAEQRATRRAKGQIVEAKIIKDRLIDKKKILQESIN